MRRILVLLAAASLGLAACGGGSGSGGASPSGSHLSPQTPADGVAPLMVTTGTAKGVGTVLVDANGLTLYHLKSETASNIQCGDSCVSTWPPLLVTGPEGPTGGPGVTGTLATVERPDGGEQVTYNGLLLYTYAGDSKPGEATGQGIGGVWYAVTPADEASGGASPSSDGYGYGGY